MKKNKSPNYPYMSLPDAVQIIEKGRRSGKSITKQYLSEISSTRKDSNASIKSGSFIRKLSALVQFGLVESHKESLTFTELSERIVYPKTDVELVNSKKEAILNVAIFKNLYEKREKAIPFRKVELKSQAIRDLGVADNASSKFIDNLVDSLIDAGMARYDNDNKEFIVFNDMTATSSEVNDETTLLMNNNNDISQAPTPKQDRNTKSYIAQFSYDNGEIEISIKYPGSLTEEGKQMIIESIKLQLRPSAIIKED